MIIQHNIQSMFTNRYLKVTTGNQTKTSERLASGYRINRAADDAAGLTISEKLRSLVRGHHRAAANVEDGISLLQVADGALSEVHDMLHRMSELAVQAANDTNTDSDREKLQDEIDAIKSEINRISTDTEFNTIKIFKDTNVPEITGTPTDILVYHDVGSRVGGVIYNGKRYQYGKDIPVTFADGNENGNIEAGQYTFLAKGLDGDVPITLLYDGGSRVPSGRKYQMEVKEDGIYVDNIRHAWSAIKNTATNRAFDPNNIEGGKYTFKLFNNGASISFEVDDGIDFESFRDDIVPDGLEAYVIKSSDVSSPARAVTTPQTTTIRPVNAIKQDYIPKLTSSNTIPGGYGMEATEEGIRMYLPAEYNPAGTGKIYFDLKTWDQLGLSEWLSGASVNPGNTVYKENLSWYTYEMKINDKGVNLGTIDFTIDSEASKDEVINSINAWQFTVNPNNQMVFNISTTDASGATISHGAHSTSLDTYGTQYNMGRNMTSALQMTFPNGQGMTVSGDNLSFTMADANNKQYTFTATNVRATIESAVTAAFQSYINSYRSAYQSAYNSYLQTTAGKNNPNSYTYNGSSITSPTPNGSVTFSDTADNYYVILDFMGKDVFSGILQQGDFNRSYTGPDYSGRYTGSVSSKSGLTTKYQSEINKITDKIYNSLTKTKINSITATNFSTTETRAGVSIASPIPTVNHTYGSSVTSEGRKVMIQAGPNTKQAIEIKLPAMNTAILKVGSVDVSTWNGASTAIEQISGAVEYISDMRSGYGATQNRLEHAFAINNVSEENAQAAESRIRDADMAEEMVHFSKNSILMQAAQSVLSQSNQTSEMVLSLLQ